MRFCFYILLKWKWWLKSTQITINNKMKTTWAHFKKKRSYFIRVCFYLLVLFLIFDKTSIKKKMLAMWVMSELGVTDIFFQALMICWGQSLLLVSDSVSEPHTNSFLVWIVKLSLCLLAGAEQPICFAPGALLHMTYFCSSEQTSSSFPNSSVNIKDHTNEHLVVEEVLLLR